MLLQLTTYICIIDLESEANIVKKRDIIRAAEKFCKDMKIECYPVYIVNICKENGIKVFEQYLPSNVFGFIAIDSNFEKKYGSKKVIVVNLSDSATRRRFTIAHELAHYILHKEKRIKIYAHRDTVGEIQTNKEKEANIFALNVLMPKNLVVDALGILLESNFLISYSDIIHHIAREFRVSEAMAEAHLNSLHLI